MEFIFLGTGSGIPSRNRNVSSIAVRFPLKKNETWLFDCGEATQHQILKSVIKPNYISKLFITHLHGDHIYGLPGILSSRASLSKQPLTIYGPKGIQLFVETCIQISGTFLPYHVQFVELTDQHHFSFDGFQITTALLDHGIPSFGYRIQTPAQSGSLNVEKLKKIGILPGPIYKDIKQGKTILLNNGEKIDGKSFISPPKRGIVFSIFGDTRPTQNTCDLANEANLMIHEATFRHNLASKARKYYHSTTVQAATIAKKAKVGTLILTHLSSRYQPEEWAEIQKEAQNIFHNTYLAYDQFQFSVADSLC